MKYIALPVEVDAEIIIKAGPVKGDGSMDVSLQSGKTVNATSKMMARMLPQEGDYVVTQSDGYVYLNPKDVFERKYRPA